jgi:hypothetical protein
MKRVSIIALIFLLVLLDLANAGDTASFAVSCTIPVIPGVNTPLLLEEEKIQVRDTAEQQQEIIQQSSQAISTNAESQVIVKTFYAR